MCKIFSQPPSPAIQSAMQRSALSKDEVVRVAAMRELALSQASLIFVIRQDVPPVFAVGLRRLITFQSRVAQTFNKGRRTGVVTANVIPGIYTRLTLSRDSDPGAAFDLGPRRRAEMTIPRHRRDQRRDAITMRGDSGMQPETPRRCWRFLLLVNSKRSPLPFPRRNGSFSRARDQANLDELTVR